MGIYPQEELHTLSPKKIAKVLFTRYPASQWFSAYKARACCDGAFLTLNLLAPSWDAPAPFDAILYC
ncbi:MAG: hypothetical protein ACSLEN_08285 [Candidatus Malihini olakiniferum]